MIAAQRKNTMREIHLDTWERREHFAFFFRNDLPFYNVNFPVDITGLKNYTKEHGISLTNTLIYLTIKALNQIPNFLYRMVKGKVVQYDQLHPSFTCLRNNEELFRLITVEYCEDLVQFDTVIKNAIRESRAYFDLSLLAGRSDFVFISTLPWIPFTGIDHTLSLKKEDAIPRVSWGKFYTVEEKTFLPYNIQVNHIFVDGIHVGKFFQTLQDEIRRQIGIRPTT